MRGCEQLECKFSVSTLEETHNIVLYTEQEIRHTNVGYTRRKTDIRIELQANKINKSYI
jgi:hypothetical protein